MSSSKLRLELELQIARWNCSATAKRADTCTEPDKGQKLVEFRVLQILDFKPSRPQKRLKELRTPLDSRDHGAPGVQQH